MILDQQCLLPHEEQTPGILDSLSNITPSLSQTSHEGGKMQSLVNKKQIINIIWVSRKH